MGKGGQNGNLVENIFLFLFLFFSLSPLSSSSFSRTPSPSKGRCRRPSFSRESPGTAAVRRGSHRRFRPRGFRLPPVVPPAQVRPQSVTFSLQHRFSVEGGSFAVVLSSGGLFPPWVSFSCGLVAAPAVSAPLQSVAEARR